jgi:hypothetical protein
LAESESVLIRLLRIAIGSGIAFMIAFICLLPPGLHFVTGPLGPIIGGFVGGNKVRASAGEAIFIGMGMSVFGGMLLILAGVVYLLAILSSSSDHVGPALESFWFIPLLVLGYIAALGTLGAMLGGAAGRHDRPKVEESTEHAEASLVS